MAARQCPQKCEQNVIIRHDTAPDVGLLRRPVIQVRP
jgi:hypothetical protein